MDACYSISSTIQSENLLNLDSSTEVNITRREKTQIWPGGKGYDFYILEFYFVNFDAIVFCFMINVPFCRLFCPEYHGRVVRKITEIYEGKFDAAYCSWSKIPQSVRDMWFNELKASNLQFSLKFLLFM